VGVHARQCLLAALVGAFAFQTWLTYADSAGRAAPPLSEQAARGRALWHEHNCQSCHQIYGFGGFLGPDLTNAAKRLTATRVDSILTEGTDVMPAFRFGKSDRRAIGQFLAELDLTGVGQAKARKRRPPIELVDELLAKAAEELSPGEAEGLELIRRERCFGCHLPNHASTHRAPDLTTVIERRGRKGVSGVLAEGVPGKAMPKFTFSETERAAVADFLAWLDRHGAAARDRFESTRPDWAPLTQLPWFEYE